MSKEKRKRETGNLFRARIIWTLTEEQRLNNHIPEEVWKLSKNHDVFIKDSITGELVQVIDLRGEKDGEFRTIALSQ